MLIGIGLVTLFGAAVAFDVVTRRMYERSLENAGNDAMNEIKKLGCSHDLSACLRILNKHYADNDKKWRYHKR